MVVSLIKERLSPKKDPPTTMAVSKGIAVSVSSAIPAAIGVRATIVPTLVPMLREIKQAAIKSPANNICGGSSERAKFTVASILPISFAAFAKAPARMNIHIMSISCSEDAPREKIVIRWLIGTLRSMAIAYMDVAMTATVMGTLSKSAAMMLVTQYQTINTARGDSANN